MAHNDHPYRKETIMDIEETTTVTETDIELSRPKLSRRNMALIATAAAGAISVVTLALVNRTRRFSTEISEPEPDQDSTED